MLSILGEIFFFSKEHSVNIYSATKIIADIFVRYKKTQFKPIRRHFANMSFEAVYFHWPLNNFYL